MKQYDFTRGNLLRHIVRFSAPIMLTNILQTSYQFIDSLWVGNLIGATALGAVAVSGSVIFTILSFIIGVNGATLTVLSQQKGMNSETGLRNYINAFVVTLSCLAVCLGIIGFFLAAPILRWMETPDVMLADASVYLQINFVGILFLIGYNFIGTVLRALGDSRTPLRFVLIAVMLNAVLDPLMIAGLGWGIKGAAIATVVSQAFALFYGLYLILRRKLVPLSVPRWPKWEEMKLILQLGVPAGLQMMVISAGLMAIMSVVNGFGEQVVAGFGAAQRIDSVLMIPSMALGSAVNSMAGQNIGAGLWHRVHQIARLGMLYNTAIMLVIALGVFLFAPLAVGLFVQEKEAWRFGAEYLRIIAFMYPFLGINFILNGIVRAAGAMIPVLMLNFISFWVLRYPLTWGMSRFFAEKGIGYGIGLSLIASSFLAFLYYRHGKWMAKELFKTEQA